MTQAEVEDAASQIGTGHAAPTTLHIDDGSWSTSSALFASSGGGSAMDILMSVASGAVNGMAPLSAGSSSSFGTASSAASQDANAKKDTKETPTKRTDIISQRNVAHSIAVRELNKATASLLALVTEMQARDKTLEDPVDDADFINIVSERVDAAFNFLFKRWNPSTKQIEACDRQEFLKAHKDDLTVVKREDGQSEEDYAHTVQQNIMQRHMCAMVLAPVDNPCNFKCLPMMEKSIKSLKNSTTPAQVESAVTDIEEQYLRLSQLTESIRQAKKDLKGNMQKRSRCKWKEE